MTQDLEKIITIDGPAGAGKSTVAQELARRLNWTYLDTGALYRALALSALRQGIDPKDQNACEKLAQSANITVKLGLAGSTSVFLDGEDVTEKLRDPQTSMAASTISAWPEVRAALLGLQKAEGKKGEIVSEGRDMGTVVFPNAGLKIFLFASSEERALRRFKELKAKGLDCAYETVLEEINERDYNDQNRTVAPLRPALDALSIDSSFMDLDAVYKVITKAFRNKFILR